MAPRISRLKKTIVVAAALALTIGGAGAAFAYWSSTGATDGTATTGDSIDFTVETGAIAGELVPGDLAGQTIAFTVTNEAEVPQYLTSITVTKADENGVWVPPAGCLSADYTVAVTQPTPGDLAPDGVFNGVVTVTLANTTDDQNACKGEEVPLHIVAA